jgi:3-hydroxyacyl-[acyl-carrier-protein] dehydratase
VIGIAEIRTLLPHRYPMLLVDRAEWTEDGARLVVTKAVTCNEPWYAELGDDEDHAYPETLVIESWMQAAGVVLSLTGELDVPPGHVMLAGKLSGLEFHRRVVPGDVLCHDVRLVRVVPGTVIVAGETRVEGEVVLSLDRVVLAFRSAEMLSAAGGAS